MEELFKKACEPCKAGATRLEGLACQALLAQLSGWKVVEVDAIQRLEKSYRFRNFAEAIHFGNEIAAAAEYQGHHPVLVTEWGMVSVTWWTHKIKGLHKNDFTMAAQADILFDRALRGPRIEQDTMGEVKVQADRYWGAQTQRSIYNFPIGPAASMPLEIIRAFGILKKAAACANLDLGGLTAEKHGLIVAVCDEIIQGRLDEHFPLVIWQTGSGTQTNMNVNEVISNRAHVLKGHELGQGTPLIHPNDDANQSQSSNDTFPTAMHIAACTILFERTMPALVKLQAALSIKAEQFKDIVKIGRTHCMDAIPLTLGQEFSGYASQIGHGLEALGNTLPHLQEIALGATAVGTGLNAPVGYAPMVTGYIQEFSELPFSSASNKFAALAAHDAIVESHGALKLLAVSLTKIANDIRLSASGPRAGLGELSIPANEPGSSIMPGKVNPTQVEALTMVCAQVLGNDLAISIGGASGQFELNVFKPMIIANFLHSAALLGDSCQAFTEYCVSGIEPNLDRIQLHLNNSLMLVTALTPEIGYENAARVAQEAHNNGTSLQEEVLALGLLSEEECVRLLEPRRMLGRETASSRE